MLKKLKRTISPLVSKHFSNVIVAEGILRGADQSFRCLFVDNSLHAWYVMSKMYNEPPRILKKRRIWIPTLKRLIKNFRNEVDLIVVVLPHQYGSEFHGLYDLKGQNFVRQIVDTSGTWDEIKGRFRTEKKRFSSRIAKSCVSYRVSHDLKDFDFFYHRMFIPHTSKKFGNLSVIDSYEDMKMQFLKGFLLFVSNGEEPIAATLCLIENQTLIYRRAGVLDGKDIYIKAGAQRALYYYMLKFAKENNLMKLDMMNSDAFLNDGVYWHKRGWGAEVYADYGESINWVYFFIPKYSEKVVSFFEQNPAIIHSDHGLKGVVGLSSGTELSPEKKKELFDNFYAPGLEGLILLTPHSNKPLEMPWSDLH